MNIETIKECLKFFNNEDELKVIDIDRPNTRYHIVDCIYTYDEIKAKRTLTFEVERTREYKHE